VAAQTVRNYGWSEWTDAPVTPLGTVSTDVRSREFNDSRLAQADIDRLLTGLASADPCVRELSVRLLGTQRNEAIANAFVSRLTSPDVPMREVAAYGLGMVRPAASSVDPLITALRDASPGVRANAAWALGRIDNGKALAPIVGLFRDSDVKVREAAVVAAGHIDSNTTIPALIRVLQNDESPAVRRVAAWALGQRYAREANEVLGERLGKESDARVREMIAWALGNGHSRTSSTALANALRRDADENVRETAAWALGEMNDRTNADALAEALDNDRSNRVRGTAAWALGQMRNVGDKVPAALARLLKDDSDDIRLKAAWSLGQVGDASVLNAVRDALKVEKSSNVRRALIRALMKTGGRSEEALADLLNSSDATVREAAVRGLVGNNAFNPWPWPWPRPRPFP
jgi:HEAT repeat protein